jgi:hydroxypyruvate isomerase
MPHFSTNLTFLLTDRPGIEPIAAAAHSNFKAIELRWPCYVPAHEIRSAPVSSSVAMPELKIPIGSAGNGERLVSSL